MLKTGSEHLEQLRDGRAVYIGRERVGDVTTHPAFRNAARTVAAIYDMKASSEHRDAMSFEDDGERYSAYFLQPRNKLDLEKRSEAHRRVAALTYGLFGRSPDHVASFVTGMSMKPEVFGGFADNLSAYYRSMRARDAYAVYAVVPPQAARDPAFYQQQNIPTPTLRVVREEDDGVVISGMKLLATGAVFANDIWIGCLIPLAQSQLRESITCVVPVNTPGLSLWSRKPYERDVAGEFESPLTYRFDESDCMVLCDEVKVPWESVFVHNDAALARAIYIQTPGHCFGNHQSNVRYWSKLGLIVGLASKLVRMAGADQVPAIRETLGRLAAQEAMLGGNIAGQIHGAEAWPGGFVGFNRRYMYAALNWCTEGYSDIIDTLRELCGGGVMQMPADISVMADPELRPLFETYWATPHSSAVDRMKLMRLVWDLIGSDFAGRHQQYEKFYAGSSLVVRNYSYTNTPWDDFHALVDGLMSRYGNDDPVPLLAAAQ